MAKKKEITDKDRIKACYDIFEIIQNDLLSLRKAITYYNTTQDIVQVTKSTFFDWIEKFNLTDHYAYAMEVRQDELFEEIIELSNGGEVLDDPVKVNRNRLQIDARKWALAKMNPKKYGDKTEVENNVNINNVNLKDLIKFNE